MCPRVFVPVRRFKYCKDPRGKVGENKENNRIRKKNCQKRWEEKVRGKLGM